MFARLVFCSACLLAPSLSLAQNDEGEPVAVEDAPQENLPGEPALTSVQPEVTAEAETAAEMSGSETGPLDTVLAPTPQQTQVVADAARRCDDRRPCLEAGGFALWPRLRMRAGFQYVQPDPNFAYIGANDGFFLEQARLGLETQYRKIFRMRLMLDATSSLPGGSPNEALRPLVGALRDAYMEWTPSAYFSVRAGQSLLPLMAEGAVSRVELNFASRSVAADGVRAGQGFAEEGLAPGREVGLIVGAERAPLGPAFAQYLVAVVNGNGRNRSANDNKLPALLARVGGGWGDVVQGGVGMQYNPRTVGELPNLYRETDLEVAGDLRIQTMGFDLLGQAAWRSTSFDTVFPQSDPAKTDNALGLTGWIVLDDPLGLPTFGVKPGYRFSYYDPRSSSSEDQLFEHSFGVRYDPPGDVPVTFLLDATLLFEGAQSETGLAQGARQLDNHRVTALMQFNL